MPILCEYDVAQPLTPKLIALAMCRTPLGTLSWRAKKAEGGAGIYRLRFKKDVPETQKAS